MRTTITLDSDVEALLRKLMTERGISFKDAVNTTLRSSLAPDRDVSFQTATYSMGKPLVSLDRALSLAGELEDADLERKLSVGR